MNWIKQFLCSKRIKELEQQIATLNIELGKRQESINKTNAYWKKKMNELHKKQVL